MDKVDRSWYFQKTFLVVDVKVEKILKMFYLRFININMFFGKRILMWRSYTINRALPIIKQVLIINKKIFAIMALDANSETFVVYVAIKR